MANGIGESLLARWMITLQFPFLSCLHTFGYEVDAAAAIQMGATARHSDSATSDQVKSGISSGKNWGN